ncbi:hypothetical protein PG985_013285 [Apiospora marii]|uniref:Ecp2 effector protein-like domain-containing protein n=1 Tax=Apiospora marii TaxID=335849 RepID=A0ABR1R8A3_9PEZI
MISTYLGACLVAFLPSQALALPATLTNTAANSVASFKPGAVASDFCSEQSYTDKTTSASAWAMDCQALKTWANDNPGLFILDSTSTDFTWTLKTSGTCTVSVKNPNVSSDGKTWIGNKDLAQILDHALAGAGATVEWTGSWKCGGDGSATTPEWWIKKVDSSSSSSSARAATFIPHDDKKRDSDCPEVPFVPTGSTPVTVCGNSSYTDMTTNDSPHWYDCETMWEWTFKQNGTWTLAGVGDDAWWRLSMAGAPDLDKCELVIRHDESGLPPVGNHDVWEILYYIQSQNDKAKGQTAEYQGTLPCLGGLGVQWWMRKTLSS